MTKRNLWLVSLLVVFGLCAWAPSLHAQGTVWPTVTGNQNTIRSEGDAEAVGTITVTTTSTGTIESSSGFHILYNLPLAYYGKNYAVGVTCAGPNATAICGALSVTVTTDNTVNLTFTNTTPFTVSGTNAISVTVRAAVQGFAAGYILQGTVDAFYKYGNPPLYISTTDVVVRGLGTMEGPATSVNLTVGPGDVLTSIGVKTTHETTLDTYFTLRISENWNDALTSLSDEYVLENNDASNFAGSVTPTYPTNGSNILIALSGVPASVALVPLPPVPCNGSNTKATNYCALGKLTIGDGVAIGDNVPYGAQSIWYQVMTTNVQAMEFADFPFKMWCQGPLPPDRGYTITATVWLTDNYPNTVKTAPPNGDMPWFSRPEGPPIIVPYFYDRLTNLLFPYVNAVPSFTAVLNGSCGTLTWQVALGARLSCPPWVRAGSPRS